MKIKLKFLKEIKRFLEKHIINNNYKIRNNNYATSNQKDINYDEQSYIVGTLDEIDLEFKVAREIAMQNVEKEILGRGYKSLSSEDIYNLRDYADFKTKTDCYNETYARNYVGSSEYERMVHNEMIRLLGKEPTISIQNDDKKYRRPR